MTSHLSSKAKGEVAESAFLYQALQRALVVCKPWGDNARFDFVVVAGGRLSRVQVRSCYRKQAGGYHLNVAKGGRHKSAYGAVEIDYIAVLLQPANLWYIIPISAIAGRQTLWLDPKRGQRHPLAKYREAWDSLISNV